VLTRIYKSNMTSASGMTALMTLCMSSQGLQSPRVVNVNRHFGLADAFFEVIPTSPRTLDIRGSCLLGLSDESMLIANVRLAFMSKKMFAIVHLSDHLRFLNILVTMHRVGFAHSPSCYSAHLNLARHAGSRSR
jgi:hypothetical protein